jgi:cell division protein FtsZ
VLLSIAGGSDLGLFEINEAASLVQEAAHPDANIIFGTVIDDSLGDEVRVTVIAAGFDSGTPTHKKLDPSAFRTGRSDGAGSSGAQGNGAQGNGAYGGVSNSGSAAGGAPPRRPEQPSPTPRAASPAAHHPTIPPQSAPHSHGSSTPAQSSGQSSSMNARTVLDIEDDDVDVPPFMRR